MEPSGLIDICGKTASAISVIVAAGRARKTIVHVAGSQVERIQKRRISVWSVRGCPVDLSDSIRTVERVDHRAVLCLASAP